METLVENQKNIVLGGIITVLVLLGANFYNDNAFMESCLKTDFTNPLILIFGLAALFAVSVGIFSGYYHSNKGTYEPGDVQLTISLLTLAFTLAIAGMLAANLSSKEALKKSELLVGIGAACFLLYLFIVKFGSTTHKSGNAHSRSTDKSALSVPSELSEEKVVEPAETETSKKKPSGAIPWWAFALGFILLLFILSKSNQQATAPVQPNTEAVDPDVIRAQARAKANGDWNEPSANQGQDRIVNGTPASSEEEAMINNNGVR